MFVIVGLSALSSSLLAGAAGAVVGGSIGAMIVARRQPGRDVPADGRPTPAKSPAPAVGSDTGGTGISRPVGPGSDSPSWSAVIDKLALGVIVMAPSGEIRFRNRRANENAGTHIGLLIDNAVKAALQRALAGEPSRQELDLYGPPQVVVVVAAEPLPQGGAVATVEDVSERRRLDAVRTDFVANISHELKTPVGALAALAEVLAGQDDPAVIARVAERMEGEAHRVARTIDDLLELSRIERREASVREPVLLRDVVDEAIGRVVALAESTAIGLDVIDVPEGLRVLGDRRQLVSALGNLVENAVKYSEPGSRVRIGVTAAEGFAEMTVTDRGIGIPAADHDRVFERFYRVDKARGRDTGGTGLGLSIVRHVATNHGGRVLLSSEEGGGSTFVLRIPLPPPARGAAR